MDTTAHKEIYRFVSDLDWDLSHRGVAVGQRRAILAALDDNFLFRNIFGAGADAPLREALGRSFGECRRIQAVASEQGKLWCASSIYEVLLALLRFLPSGDDFVFRGHLDARWQLVPSFFRMQPRTSLMLHGWTIYGAYRWVEHAVGTSLRLTPFQAEAAAQHYGSQTTLLDVTESLRVAAYFATTPLHAKDKQADTGAIYVLSVADLEKVGRSVLRGRTLPSVLSRIHLTKGAFVSGLGYTKGYAEGDAAPIVRGASDIVDWMNASAHRMTLSDEYGVGIEDALTDGKLAESTAIRFKQIGETFVDDTWDISRQQLSFVGGIQST